ncbi:MAG: tyrosine-specific transport protein [Moritella sp.]
MIFTSFGFHGSIPSIVRYVGLDIKTLKKVMVFGASAPLCIYLIWQFATQGVLSQNDLLANNSLTSFIQTLSTVLQQPGVSQSVSVFADLALATSFLGVSLGLFDLLSNILKRNNGKKHRLQTAVVTFLPPLGFALFYPQGFITALGYAAIALVILAIFLPVAMVFKQRKTAPEENGYRVRGGNLTLALAGLTGCLIITAQFLQMFAIIPSVG